MKALLWSKVQQQVVGHPHQDEQRVLLDFEALRQIRLPNAHIQKGGAAAACVGSGESARSAQRKNGVLAYGWRGKTVYWKSRNELSICLYLSWWLPSEGEVISCKSLGGTLHAVEVCHQLNIPFPKHLSGVLPSKSADFQGWKNGIDKNGYHKLPGFGRSYMPLWHLHLQPVWGYQSLWLSVQFWKVSVLGRGRSEECRDLCLKGWFPCATSSFLVLFCTFTYCSI